MTPGPNIADIDRAGDQGGGGDQEDHPGLKETAEDGGEEQGTGNMDEIELLSGSQEVISF